MIHAYYHWWAEPSDSPIICNLRTPILLAVASLRSVNSEIPITVLDKSKEPNEWFGFDKKLNFEVVHDPQLGCVDHKEVVNGWKHLSRFFDLIEHTRDTDETVMYVDSDVFWFRDPCPLAKNPNKLCIDGWNTGFFYFNASEAHKWFDVFQAYTKAAVYSEEVRDVVGKYLGYDPSRYTVVDEQPISYIAKKHKYLLNIIPHFEHINGVKLHLLDPETVKMIHCNGISVANPIAKTSVERFHSRGLMCLFVKEFYEGICRVLSEEDINQVFTPKERKIYLPQQFSMFDKLEEILKTKRADGLYQIDEYLSAPVLI